MSEYLVEALDGDRVVELGAFPTLEAAQAAGRELRPAGFNVRRADVPGLARRQARLLDLAQRPQQAWWVEKQALAAQRKLAEEEAAQARDLAALEREVEDLAHPTAAAEIDLFKGVL